MIVQSLPPTLARALQQATTGERVVWIGRPDSGRELRRGLWSWIFSVPWTIFSIGWTAVPVSVLLFADGPDPMNGWGRAAMVVATLFGLPFIAVGVGAMAGPFLSASRARHTVFALTDTRLAVITGGRKTIVRSIPLSQIIGIELRLRRGGRGDLRLDLGTRRDHEGDLVRSEEILIGLDDVAAAERHFRAALDRSARAAAAHPSRA